MVINHRGEGEEMTVAEEGKGKKAPTTDSLLPRSLVMLRRAWAKIVGECQGKTVGQAEEMKC